MSDLEPTLADVAAKANVSVTTASVALTGRGRVSDRTRDLVVEAAASLGYRPSSRARYFRTKDRPRMVAGIFDGLPDGSEGRDPKIFWQRAISAFIHELHAQNIVTVVLPTFDSPTLRSLPLSAIVTTLTGTSGIGVPTGAPDGVPIIAVGLLGDEVGIDAYLRPDFNAMNEVLDYLRVRGSQRPAFLATPQPLAPIGAFELGYGAWCANNSVEPLFRISADPFAATTEIIASGADSLLLLGDDGLPDFEAVMAAIASAGLSMPSDFMLLSLSESVRGEYTTPTVSTLSWPGHDCGIAVARTVIDGLATGKFTSGSLVHRIDTRESTNRLVSGVPMPVAEMR